MGLFVLFFCSALPNHSVFVHPPCFETSSGLSNPHRARPRTPRYRLIALEIDTPVANAVAKLLQRSKKPSAEQLASVEVILEAIRASKVWNGFVDALKEKNVSMIYDFIQCIVLR